MNGNTHRTLRKDDRAVAGIVVAVMMVGLTLAIVSLIQIYYVPKWMAAREVEHLGNVEDQFSRLKFTIDQQAVAGSAGSRGKDIAISSSITLGSENLGFLVTQRAFGRLNLILQGSQYTIYMKSGAYETDDLTIMKYVSDNAYYLNQGYVLESGAVVLNQSGSNVFLVKPSMTTSFASNTLTINWTCINLQAAGGVTSLSGYGTYPIQTKYVGNASTTFNNVTFFNISTYHPTIWKQFFIDLITGTTTNLPGKSLTYGSTSGCDFYIPAFTVVNNKDKVSIVFKFNNNNILTKVKMNVNLVTIAVQFAPGWIG